MRIHSLAVSGFRNLETQSILLPSRITVLRGRNGQGKTSFLEAIFYLAHAKSFRTSKNRELMAWESPGSLIEANLETIDGTKTLSCSLAKSGTKISLNGNPLAKASAFYGQFTCVAFTPEEMQLVQGAPLGRRKFLDRIISMANSSYVDNLVRYQRALKSRNVLLHPKNKLLNESELKPWTDILLELGVRIAKTRIELFRSLIPKAKKYYIELRGSEAGEEIEIKYQSHFLNEENLVLEVDQLEELYENSLEKDKFRKATSVGIHRDDFEISLNYGDALRSARSAASQGQARTMTLCLKLAAIDYLKDVLGETPVILLDDVESELDSTRRNSMYDLIHSSDSQIFITTTEVSQGLKERISEATFLEVKKGRIELEKAQKSPLNKA